jgi:hypothetical protein
MRRERLSVVLLKAARYGWEQPWIFPYISKGFEKTNMWQSERLKYDEKQTTKEATCFIYSGRRSFQSVQGQQNRLRAESKRTNQKKQTLKANVQLNILRRNLNGNE